MFIIWPFSQKPPDIEKIKITFLGTGTSQGIPVIGCDCAVCLSGDKRDNRLRTSALIQTEGKTLCMDAGPDFRQQMLRASVQQLDAILLTHEHNDHVAGLDDVRPFNFKQRKDMPVFATPQVLNQLKTRFQYAFAPTPYPGSPKIRLHPIEKDRDFEVEGIRVKPIEGLHGNLPVMGFRIGELTYLTDIKTMEETEKEKARNSKLLVINALHRKEHHSHLHLADALRLIEELSPERALLTHLSHRMGLHADLLKELPPNIGVAYDGLEILI